MTCSTSYCLCDKLMYPWNDRIYVCKYVCIYVCNITLTVTLKGSYKDSPDVQWATLKDSSWIRSDPADPCQLSGSVFISHSPTVTTLTRLSFRVLSHNSDCWFLSTSWTTFEKDAACLYGKGGIEEKEEEEERDWNTSDLSTSAAHRVFCKWANILPTKGTYRRI
jgi:hypothetical protein